MVAGLFDQSFSWRSTVLALRVRGDHERNDPLRISPRGTVCYNSIREHSTYAPQLSYPMSEPGGTGHVVGIPFIVAYIDAQGSDYVGAITWIGTIGNMVFWCLVPAIALWVHAAVWRRRNLAEQFAPASQ